MDMEIIGIYNETIKKIFVKINNYEMLKTEKMEKLGRGDYFKVNIENTADVVGLFLSIEEGNLSALFDYIPEPSTETEFNTAYDNATQSILSELPGVYIIKYIQENIPAVV
ncbi:MAG TPA: hypothetical protein EYP05_00980 [Piscirickettsiaceae bacterium]|nr:hypothetical protein [Piscirickettsiaceae bacterium]